MLVDEGLWGLLNWSKVNSLVTEVLLLMVALSGIGFVFAALLVEMLIFVVASVFATELEILLIVADIFPILPELEILPEVPVGLVNVVIVNFRDLVKRLEGFDVEVMPLVLARLDPVLELTVAVEEVPESAVE